LADRLGDDAAALPIDVAYWPILLQKSVEVFVAR
jgi:hypothetical protein